jgi:hypothetical protein
VFCDLFVQTVQQCMAAGLVDGKKLHVDSSLVRADASKDSIMQSSPELIAALRQAYAVEEQKLEERPLTGVNATHISTTDPEATLARSGGASVSQLSYKHHRAIDDAQGVITAVQTTPGHAGDAAQLPGLVNQHENNTGSAAAVVVGDKHYGSAANYRYCQSQNLAAHLGAAEDYAHKGMFDLSAFAYEADRDRYRCPAGHYLYYHNYKKDDQLIQYQIEDARLCAQCPLRAQCTRAAAGRSVSRPIFSELVQAGREQGRSEAARRDRRRRQHLLEGSFADAANNHGFKRARWRGLWRQQIQDWLIAAVQNLRILMNRARKSSGQAAQSATLILKVIRSFICALLLLQPASTRQDGHC